MEGMRELSVGPVSEAVADRKLSRAREVPEALLTVSEVAALLKVPVSWVYEHTRPECLNPLPCMKLGKYLRFSAAEIADYLAGIRSGARRRGP